MNRLYKIRDPRGYTLMEILVVMAIMALLASIIMASLSASRQRARVAKMQGDAHGIRSQIEIVRNKYLTDVTGDFNASASEARSIAAWNTLGFTEPPRDPWGNVYRIDENEGEFSSEMCRYDIVYSPGPSHTLGVYVCGGLTGQPRAGSGEQQYAGRCLTPADGVVAINGGANYAFAINFFRCKQSSP